MSHKFNSAEAYADMRSLGDKVFQMDVIGPGDVQGALDALSGLRGVDVPTAKSFLDWARKEHLVEGVTGVRGRYRWAASVEDEAAEIGRQMAQEHVYVTDMDPEHPMILQDEEEPAEVPLEVETCQHHADDLADLSEVADVRVYIACRQTRIPRKEKKRMKKRIRETMGVEKVQVIRDMDKAWEMANR